MRDKMWNAGGAHNVTAELVRILETAPEVVIHPLCFSFVRLLLFVCLSFSCSIEGATSTRRLQK